MNILDIVETDVHRLVQTTKTFQCIAAIKIPIIVNEDVSVIMGLSETQTGITFVSELKNAVSKYSI